MKLPQDIGDGSLVVKLRAAAQQLRQPSVVAVRSTELMYIASIACDQWANEIEAKREAMGC